MINLVEKERCTGCGACAYVCSKKCISMVEDELHILYPQIDTENCIECNRCVNTCPILSPPDSRAPLEAYAAWSSDDEERRTSASGGVAAEVYKKAVSDGFCIAGAIQNNDFSVVIQQSNDITDIQAFKNSKYVFSSALDLYSQLRESLKRGEKSIVVCLPCQVAAIRKIFRDNPNIILMDVVCHGTTPTAYLQQHIAMLDKQCNDVSKRMSFRDPFTYTYTFTFTLYNSGDELIYAKRTKDGDTYQFGYHRAINYRENCYHCPFAQSKRISDVTLSDYKGLGKMAPCSYNELKVSSVLVNTKRGQDFIHSLIENNNIVAEKRPTLEPINGDAQLRHHSLKSRYRYLFEENIQKYKGDYEKAIMPVLKVYNRDEQIKHLKAFPIRVVRKIFKTIGLKK